MFVNRSNVSNPFLKVKTTIRTCKELAGFTHKVDEPTFEKSWNSVTEEKPQIQADFTKSSNVRITI